MDLSEHVAVVTGGAGGIGRALCTALARAGVRAIGVVDRDEQTEDFCATLNEEVGRTVAHAYRGDVAERSFREHVFGDLEEQFGCVSVCVPAAAILRDGYGVKIRSDSDTASQSPSIELYDDDSFRKTIEINLVAPVYWALRTVASVALARVRRGCGVWTPDEHIEGAVALIGSISAAGNSGQIAYSSAKAGLEGARSTLAKEGIRYGVRCVLIHPGFTDTTMARSLGDNRLRNDILPNTQLQRLIQPVEIADAVCFALRNPAVSGVLNVDAGWHARPR